MLPVSLTEPAFVASVIAACLAAVGVIATMFNRDWAQRNSAGFASFAAGVLIATSMLHLLPRGIALTENGPWIVLTGYLLMYVINNVFTPKPGGDGGAENVAVVTPVIGIAFHSFVDGLEYPILFADDFFSGALAASGLIMHEVAEGVIVFALLTRAGLSVFPAAFIALCAASLTTPLGAVTALTALENADEQVFGVLTSLAAGALLYVGATHLPMHIYRDSSARRWPLFVLGVALSSMFTLFHELGHLGEHDHHHGPAEEARPHNH
ncbi:MAG: ZIP family metal transporter [Pseudomonadota bacterium]